MVFICLWFTGKLCRKREPGASHDSRWLQPCQAASIQYSGVPEGTEKVLRIFSFFAELGTPPPATGAPGLSAFELHTQPRRTLHQRLVQDLLGNRLQCSFYRRIQPGSCSLSQNSGTPKQASPSPVWSRARHRKMNQLCILPFGNTAPVANMDEAL